MIIINELSDDSSDRSPSLRVHSLIYFLKVYDIFRYILLLFMFQGIPFLIPYFYLDFGFKTSYKLKYKAMPLISIFIPVLKPVSVINKLFPDIILEKPAYYFHEVSFISTISFNINYQIF